MKKYLFLLNLLALWLSGCSHEELLKNQSTYSEARIFTTSFESDESRTYIEEGRLSRWTEDDRISLFDSSTSNLHYKFDGKTGDTSGTFSMVEYSVETGKVLTANYAVYPYASDVKMTDSGVITTTLPARQTYAANSFGLGDNTMVAVTENTDDTFLSFKNVGGCLKLQLYGDDVTVKSITLTGNNEEKLAGHADITAVYGKAPIVRMLEDAGKSITLDCGDGVKLGATKEEATAFWMVVPPTMFEEGITVTVKDVNGKVFAQSTSNELVIERNVVKPMAAFEVGELVLAKQCVLLDVVGRNGDDEEGNSKDTGRNLYSADYILEVAGIPYLTLTDLSEAMEKASMIVISSPIKNGTFSQTEWDSLAEWVKQGGIVIAPALQKVPAGASNLFGISASTLNKTRSYFQWENARMNDAELDYVDTAEEEKVYIGNANGTEGSSSINSCGYQVTSAEVLATFDTGETAVTRHALGNGFAYTFGVYWRDVIQRSHLNKDFSASRGYSNLFEPSADAYSLFVRSVYAKNQDYSVWKFTVPDGYQGVLIPTHDCDSRTAYDEMHYLSTYEKELGMSGHYFITVHYYRDEGYLSAFYDEKSIEKSKQLLADGHTVGSHSIGHFPDFSKTDRFPMTVVTKDEYRPRHDVNTGETTGGSTWAEIALSKQIIEEDLGNKVRSFRTGHLTMNKNIPIAMKEAGYSFSSCYSSGDVLTAFPFFERIGNAWDGELSSVLQIPMHFSDVLKSEPMDENNWSTKPALWLDILNKLTGNYAPSVILIHPNREWKMKAQKMLVEMMDRNKIGLYNFEDYGDFWLQRNQLDFEYSLLPKQDKLLIQVDKLDANNKAYVFGIDSKNGVVPKEVILVDKENNTLLLRVKQISTNRYVAHL